MATNPILKVPRWIKITAIIVILSIVLVVIGSFSTKKYIESHSEEWIGRKVKIGSLWFNPLNFSVSLGNFKLYEQNSDSVFVSFSKFYVNASVWPYLMNDEISISEVKIEQPYVQVIMKGDQFNFDDLMQRFSPTDSTAAPEPPSEPLRFSVSDISMSSGEFLFFNETFHGGMGLKSIDASMPLVSSSNPLILFDLKTKLTSGGSLKSHGNFRQDNMTYHATIKADSLAIGFLLPFIDKAMYVTGIKGLIDTDLEIAGQTETSVSEARGVFRLSDFELIDTLKKPVMGAKKLEVQMDTISAIKGRYAIRLAELDHPYLRFDMTPTGNNLMRGYITANDSTQSTAPPGQESTDTGDAYIGFFKQLNHYLIEIGQEYAINYYTVDNLKLTEGNIEFNDYTLNQPFHFLLEKLNVSAVNVRSEGDTIGVDMNTLLNHSGTMNGRLVLYPKQIGDLYLHYTIEKLKVTDFTPYSEYYVAHPFWDGEIFLESTTTVKNHQLKSTNKLLVKHLEVGDKVASLTAFKIPLKLAVSLLKDVHGNVDLKIPVKGDVSDPKFKVMPVVLKIMRDLIIKAAAAPFKLLARAFGVNEDDIRDIKYDYMQEDIRTRQKKTLDLLVRILNEKKEISVKLIEFSSQEWEIRQYALFEAKKRYYQETNKKETLTAEDSTLIDRIQPLDTAFHKYMLRKNPGAAQGADVEELAVELVGREGISQKLVTVKEKRRANLLGYLATNGADSTRYKIVDAKPEEIKVYRERPKYLVSFEAAENTSPPGSKPR